MMRIVAGLLVWLAPVTCWAAPLRVGAGETFTKPCDAIAAAKTGDVIEVAAGTYTDSCSIAVQGLTLRGVDGLPKIDLSATDHPAQYKGIYVIDASDVTLENLELTGAHISDDNGANAAGVRVQAPNLTVRSCYIHDNQNGILGGTTGALTIEHTEFSNNGLGDGCNQGGCTHNIYVANIDQLTFRFNWSHHIANDTTDKGHLLKSRAKTNYIVYNRITGEDRADSYEIDLPNGGLAILIGNLIEKGPKSGNPTLFTWGEEGATNPDKRVFIANNTFVNDLGKGTFINAQGATLTVHNNLLVGTGTPINGGTISDDNLTTDPEFVDKANFDYHLQPTSPAIGKAVEAGSADQFSLTPTSEYKHPLQETPRSNHKDLGAYESSKTESATDAGTPKATDAGKPIDASTPKTTDAGKATDPTNKSSDGCSCNLTQRPNSRSLPTLLVAASLVMLRARRKRAPKT